MTVKKKTMNKETDNFEPRIVGFLCKWCPSSAVDVAGTQKIPYPANIRIIKLMCAGSLDATYVLRALQEGADGVLVAGCPSGNCHYVSGDTKAKRGTDTLMTILESWGLEEQRVRVESIGADDGAKFASVVTELTRDVRKLGPNPMSKNWSF